MAKKPQPQKEQMDAEDELLNFDLEELSGDESSAEEEVIELVELVEADQDEEKTRELTVRNRLKEKPPVKPAKAVKPAPVKAPAQAKNLPADDEEPELDLSDLTLDMDVEATRPQQPVGEDEITEADLENLLKETDSGEISFDLSTEEEGEREGKDEEVADADLEARGHRRGEFPRVRRALRAKPKGGIGGHRYTAGTGWHGQPRRKAGLAVGGSRSRPRPTPCRCGGALSV